MSLKIRQLYDELGREKIYPLNTTKSVKDTTTKKSLYDLMKDSISSYEEVSIASPSTGKSEEPSSGLVIKKKLEDLDLRVTEVSDRFRTVEYSMNVGKLFENDTKVIDLIEEEGYDIYSVWHFFKIGELATDYTEELDLDYDVSLLTVNYVQSWNREHTYVSPKIVIKNTSNTYIEQEVSIYIRILYLKRK